MMVIMTIIGFVFACVCDGNSDDGDNDDYSICVCMCVCDGNSDDGDNDDYSICVCMCV